jgi:beta-phosphoglucomutase-like phosphatase (HAD superfamily)
VEVRLDRPTLGLFMELETFVLDHGRRRVFDAVRSALGQAGFDLTPQIFARMALGSGVGRYVPSLLSFLKVRFVSQARIGVQVETAVRRAVCSEPRVRAGLIPLLQRARGRGIRVVAVSLLDAESAGHVAGATGLTALGVETVVADAWRARPSPENVIARTLERLRLPSGACVALVTCAAATESALCAGLRVLALPDEFTSFQPFTGADEILDTWNPEAVQSFLGLDRGEQG